MTENINMIEFMEYLENLKCQYESELKSSMHYVLIIRNSAKLEIINEIEQKIKEVCLK